MHGIRDKEGLTEIETEREGEGDTGFINKELRIFTSVATL